MSPASPHKIALAFHAPEAEALVPFLRRHLRKAAQLVDTPLRSLSVAIVDDAQMSRLHDQFLGDPSTTDILSFPLRTKENGQVLEGELVICLDEARRCAEARQIEVQKELLLYCIHGLLHLSGYDDTTDAAFKRMHAREDELLSKLKIGKVFAAKELEEKPE